MLWGPLYINSVHLRLARTQVLTSQTDLKAQKQITVQKKSSSRSVTSMSNCTGWNFTIRMRLTTWGLRHIDLAHFFLFGTMVLASLTDYEAQKSITVQKRRSCSIISISICTERNFTLKMKPEALGTPKYLFSMYYFCPCINLGLSD